jgi:DNA-binding LytR/AlgR family response regulator
MQAEGHALTALVADDERLLREQLKSRLATAWPQLRIVDEARDGNEALAKADALRPDVVFLDIRMPGLTGIEAAREILTLPGWSGEIVFVTAYDEYAIAAFEHGAIDYLLKPVEVPRLAQTAARLQQRLARKQADSDAREGNEALLDTVLQKLAKLQHDLQGGGEAARPYMQWIQATSGLSTRLIAVRDVLFFRSDDKYTRVQTATGEAFIRTPIRELVPQLDPQQFCQVHRSTIVNMAAIEVVTRDEAGRQRVHIRGQRELLEVSRSFAHLFRGG